MATAKTMTALVVMITVSVVVTEIAMAKELVMEMVKVLDMDLEEMKVKVEVQDRAMAMEEDMTMDMAVEMVKELAGEKPILDLAMVTVTDWAKAEAMDKDTGKGSVWAIILPLGRAIGEMREKNLAIPMEKEDRATVDNARTALATDTNHPQYLPYFLSIFILPIYLYLCIYCQLACLYQDIFAPISKLFLLPNLLIF